MSQRRPSVTRRCTAVTLGAGMLVAAAVGVPAQASPTPVGATAPAMVWPHQLHPAGWTPVGKALHGLRAVYVTRTAGGAVGLMWMDQILLKFRWVPGYLEPAGVTRTAADKNASTWVGTMMAAFNGGFRNVSKDISGWFYNGRTYGYLGKGYGSFAVGKNGRFYINAWGRPNFANTSAFVAIRQERLPLLIDGGRISPNASCGLCWGGTNGGLSTAKRAAVGVRADGSVVFAFGDNVTPRTMAVALAGAGVRYAMVLDMNISWPTGYWYDRNSRNQIVGHKIQPGIYRDPSTYLSPFQRDFVAASPR